MKVLCIDGDFELVPEYPTAYIPVFNEIYIVTDSHYFGDNLLYKLAEIPDTDIAEFYWDADAFVPLSGIDETEMVRNLNTQKVII